jgi:hypothetical protein
MLEKYYTLMLILTGDLAGNIIRPITNTSDQDADIIKGWLNQGETDPEEPQTRGIWIMGDGFVESLVSAGTSDATDLMTNVLKVGLVTNDYQHTANVNDGTIDLRVFPEWQNQGSPGADPKVTASIFGLRNSCLWTTDVLTTASPVLTAIASEYNAKGASGSGFSAGVFKDWDGTGVPPSPYKSLVDGWDIENLVTRNDVNTVGRSAYFNKIFTNVWAKIWAVAQTPIVPLDVPSFDDGGMVNFMQIAGNPMQREAKATIKFVLARADRVEVDVYDVSGRRVTRLADRQFPAGQHEIVWDGLDSGGRQVARGVYFTQVKFKNANYVNAKKLTVLH